MTELYPMRRPYLAIVRAGDRSLHRGWLASVDRTFDLWISYYGDQPGLYTGDAEYYSEARGGKYPALFELMLAHGEAILQYEAVWLPDDDLQADTATLNRMFQLYSERSLQLAQPAFTKHAAYPVTARRLDHTLRYIPFVDARAPLFSREALRVCWPSFGRSLTGWGLGHVWAKMLSYPERGIAILDRTPVKHSRPTGEGDLYTNVRLHYGSALDEGIDMAVLAEFGIDPLQPSDIGGFDGEKEWNPWLAPVEKESRLKRKSAAGKGAGSFKRKSGGKPGHKPDRKPSRKLVRKPVRKPVRKHAHKVAARRARGQIQVRRPAVTRGKALQRIVKRNVTFKASAAGKPHSLRARAKQPATGRRRAA